MTNTNSTSSPNPLELKKTTDVDWSKVNLNLLADIAESHQEDEEETNNE